jgi:cytochrome b
MHIKVWDLPLRLFHWLLVIAVGGALVTVNLGGNWMIWHGRFGLAVVGLLAFRLVWGLVGSTHARFASFFPTPQRLMEQVRGQWHRPGHTPLGALSVFAMLLLFGFQAVSGLFATDDIAFSGPLARQVSSALSSDMSRWHRWTEELLYLLIALHLLAIIFYRLRGKALVAAMIHGRKHADAQTPPASGGGWIMLILALAVAAAAVYLASGAWIPAPAPAPATPAW